MLIIKREPDGNWAHKIANRDDFVPDDYAAVPDEFTEAINTYLQWSLPTFDTDGKLIAVADNPEARAAQAAIDANIVIPPTNAEKNRADIDYLAVMLGVEL